MYFGDSSDNQASPAPGSISTVRRSGERTFSPMQWVRKSLAEAPTRYPLASSQVTISLMSTTRDSDQPAARKSDFVRSVSWCIEGRSFTSLHDQDVRSFSVGPSGDQERATRFQ